MKSHFFIQKKTKTQRDVGLLNEFLKQQEETRKIQDIKPDELNNYQCEFILSIK